MSEPIKWKTEPPTEPGYYWGKYKRTGEVEIVLVRQATQIESTKPMLLGDLTGSMVTYHLNEWLWSDRIEVPS